MKKIIGVFLFFGFDACMGLFLSAHGPITVKTIYETGMHFAANM